MCIIFQIKTYLLTSKQSKNFVYSVLCELERLEENAFSTRRKGFLVHQQIMLID
jgi:hypothetical protein